MYNIDFHAKPNGKPYITWIKAVQTQTAKKRVDIWHNPYHKSYGKDCFERIISWHPYCVKFPKSKNIKSEWRNINIWVNFYYHYLRFWIWNIWKIQIWFKLKISCTFSSQERALICTNYESNLYKLWKYIFIFHRKDDLIWTIDRICYNYLQLLFYYTFLYVYNLICVCMNK